MIHYMIKAGVRIFMCGMLFFLTDISFAQNNTSSPYSIFGIGEIETRDFGRTAGMGNVGIGLKSTNFLNQRNPAGLSGIDTLTFILDVAGSVKFSKFITTSEEEKTSNFNFKNLAAGFRISKMWTTGVGLSPFSSVGYDISGDQYVEGAPGSYKMYFSGSGGINKFYWANSLELFKGLSIGATASFLFGTITHNETTSAMNIRNTYAANKIYFDFGLQYSHLIGQYTYVTVGGVYGYKTDIKLSPQVYITDSYGNVLKDQVTGDNKSYIPQSFGAGFSISRNKRDYQWLLAVDYKRQQWSVDKTYRSGIKYTDSDIYSFGLQLIPNTKRAENYFQVIRYQIGGMINNSYMQINGHQLQDYSFSVGLGLPFRNRTYINVALNMGQAATGYTGGIKENYTLLSVNLSLIELWFAKQKYE